MQESAKASEEIPWTSYVDALLSWRRFVIGGIALSWAVILILGLLVPRTYECEAVLSFPPLTAPRADIPKAGIPIPLYKRFSGALADERVLSKGLKSVMDPPEIRSLLQTLDQHVMPVTTSPLGDAQRMSRDDSVIGVRIAASGQPAEKTEKVVTALGDLCRDTLIRTLAQEQIGRQMAQVNDEARQYLLQQTTLRVEMESLVKQDAELTRLTREFPEAGVSGGRQVVNTGDGGYRYLPPATQLVGVRAQMADYRHQTRVAEHRLSLSALRLRFFQALNEDLNSPASSGPHEADAPSVIREALKRFVAQPPSDEADLPTLKLEVENLASALSAFSQVTALTQPPTVRKKPRVPAMAGAGALAVLLVLGGALLGESWRRLHASS